MKDREKKSEKERDNDGNEGALLRRKNIEAYVKLNNRIRNRSSTMLNIHFNALTVILACISYFFPFLPTNLQLSSSTLADIIWNLSWLFGKTDSRVFISCFNVFRQAIWGWKRPSLLCPKFFGGYVHQKHSSREKHDEPDDYPTKWRPRLRTSAGLVRFRFPPLSAGATVGHRCACAQAHSGPPVRANRSKFDSPPKPEVLYREFDHFL